MTHGHLYAKYIEGASTEGWRKIQEKMEREKRAIEDLEKLIEAEETSQAWCNTQAHLKRTQNMQSRRDKKPSKKTDQELAKLLKNLGQVETLMKANMANWLVWERSLKTIINMANKVFPVNCRQEIIYWIWDQISVEVQQLAMQSG